MEGEAEGVGLGRKDEDLGRASEHNATVRKSCQSHQEHQRKDLPLRSARLGGLSQAPLPALCSAVGWDFLGRDSSAINQQQIQGAVSGGH